ncbi:MAG: SRPBCC family protein [Alphaproteobacteria bacterium]|nr:SRPBCC family protein [Alphaproteobacteria bacterium]
MSMHQSNARPLRLALSANGIFSLLTGASCVLAPMAIVSLVFAHPPVLFGIAAPTLITELGIGLLAFAALVFWTAGQSTVHRGRAKLITLLDIGWVLISAILLIAAPGLWTSSGVAIVIVVAVIVAAFALEQAFGLHLLYQGKSDVDAIRRGNQLALTAKAVTQASPERVWQVMSHQEAYADVADNISKVEVTKGSGSSLERRCYDNDGKSWNESCTLWDEGRAFAFRVHTEAPDYPYPISALSGEWSLSPVPDGTQIQMTFHVTAKSGLINALMFRLMAAPFSVICDRLLQRWIEIMEGTARPAHDDLALPGNGSAAQPV